MFLWTYCCSFTSIYFAWPIAEPWKLENKLLFSKSCQRWLQSQRVDCGTDILSDQEASSAAPLSPQLHTCPWKTFVYLVYVGSPRRCHQSERWERCPSDTPNNGCREEKKRREKKKEKMKGRKLANPEQSSFELCKGHRGAPIGILQKYTLCCQTVKQAFPLKNIAWILPKNSVRRRTRDNHSPEFSYREAQLPGQGSCSPHLV